MAHLRRHVLTVVARVRAEDDAAVPPVRRAGRALARAAGALLAVRLLAAAGDLAARLRVGRALPLVRLVPDYGLVHQPDVGLDAEDLVQQLDGVNDLSGHVVDVNSHLSLLRAPRSSALSVSALSEGRVRALARFASCLASLPSPLAA